MKIHLVQCISVALGEFKDLVESLEVQREKGCGTQGAQLGYIEWPIANITKMFLTIQKESTRIKDQTKPWETYCLSHPDNHLTK